MLLSQAGGVLVGGEVHLSTGSLRHLPDGVPPTGSRIRASASGARWSTPSASATSQWRCVGPVTEHRRCDHGLPVPGVSLARFNATEPDASFGRSGYATVDLPARCRRTDSRVREHDPRPHDAPTGCSGRHLPERDHCDRAIPHRPVRHRGRSRARRIGRLCRRLGREPGTLCSTGRDGLQLPRGVATTRVGMLDPPEVSTLQPRVRPAPAATHGGPSWSGFDGSWRRDAPGTAARAATSSTCLVACMASRPARMRKPPGARRPGWPGWAIARGVALFRTGPAGSSGRLRRAASVRGRFNPILPGARQPYTPGQDSSRGSRSWRTAPVDTWSTRPEPPRLRDRVARAAERPGARPPVTLRHGSCSCSRRRAGRLDQQPGVCASRTARHMEVVVNRWHESNTSDSWRHWRAVA
jgi:hypothetical protein